jgi:exonuclease SbcD
MFGPCPVRYSGSPIAIDFGEEENASSVTMVEVSADTTAKARVVPVPVAVPLRTIRGSVEQLAALEVGDAWLRVYVTEPARAGLREQVQEMFPRALEIRVDPGDVASKERAVRVGRSAPELFADYLEQRGSTDPHTQAVLRHMADEAEADIRTFEARDGGQDNESREA